MSKKFESRALEANFEAKNSPEINQKLETLKNLWMDPEVFQEFHTKINEILEKEPESRDIVMAELDKTEIGASVLFEKYKRDFRSAVEYSA